MCALFYQFKDARQLAEITFVMILVTVPMDVQTDIWDLLVNNYYNIYIFQKLSDSDTPRIDFVTYIPSQFINDYLEINRTTAKSLINIGNKE